MTFDDHLAHLTALDFPLTGNTGKVRTLIELARLINAKPGLSILDIGCIGPNPLDFWRPLFALYGGQFQLTGIDPDADGIARTQARLHAITEHPVNLIAGNGYDLTRLFPDQQFDVIVFTQVLEHVFRYREFLTQVHHTVQPGGDVLFTLDSGHYPHQRWQDSVKGILARLGREHHYEHGWRDDELNPVLNDLDFSVISREFYCTTPSKRLHNKYIDAAQKNDVMRLWFAQEYAYNQHITFDETAKRQFLILFYHVQRANH
ncbi:MAG: class I SAM-dependent methyltransferase [Anaerolineae bacterium]|nr:class I SAM-dependent methyltransferase [Anaerolineae bacterium]